MPIEVACGPHWSGDALPIIEMQDIWNAACGIHHMISGLDKPRAHLPADLHGVQVIGKGTPQPFGQDGAGGDDTEGIAMQEDNYRIGIDGPDGIQSKDMVGGFENPAAIRPLGVQMLEEAAVKPECLMG